MGAIEVSLMVGLVQAGRYKIQFRSALPGNRRSYFGAKTRGFTGQRDQYVSDRQSARDDHMYEQTPAIGRRRNFLDKETVDATDIELCQGEV